MVTEGEQQLVRIALGDTSRLRLDQRLVPSDHVVQPGDVAVSLFHLSLESRHSVAQRRVLGAQLSVQPQPELPYLFGHPFDIPVKGAFDLPQPGSGPLHNRTARLTRLDSSSAANSSRFRAHGERSRVAPRLWK
jgi:hypothetical protein